MNSYKLQRTIIGRLDQGEDLYNGITRIVQEHHIKVGRVTGMGAVQKARLAYYDQRLQKYSEIAFDEPMEILSLYGNISLKEGEPFLHTHVVLSDEKGNGKGGHLLPGNAPVFACEIVIEEYEGPALVRQFDDQSGLALWTNQLT